MERRLAAAVLRCHVSVVLEEQRHDVRVPGLGGGRERRDAVSVCLIDICFVIEQHLDDPVMTSGRSSVQGRPAELVAQADLLAPVEQHLCRIDVAKPRSHHQRGGGRDASWRGGPLIPMHLPMVEQDLNDLRMAVHCRKMEGPHLASLLCTFAQHLWVRPIPEQATDRLRLAILRSNHERRPLVEAVF
eukprot:2107916-Prymnesium_polylepis.1